MDDEAKLRGELPPSVRRKLQRDFPMMMDGADVVDFDMKKALMDTKVEIPLHQLLYHAPDLWYKTLNLIGGQPTSSYKKKQFMASQMEIDGEAIYGSANNGDTKVNHIMIDTSKVDDRELALQSVLVQVEDSRELEFLVDGGALVSCIPFFVIRGLNLEGQIQPSTKTIRYGGGGTDIPLGKIKLKLQFSPDIVVHHTFSVVDHALTPMLLGMDFKLGARAFADPELQVLKFRTTDENGQPSVMSVPTFPFKGDLETKEVISPNDGGRLVAPIAVRESEKNRTMKDVTLETNWSIEPGENQLIWLELEQEASEWTQDMVLQPSELLLRRHGVYMFPSLFEKGGQGQYCVMVANMNASAVNLPKGVSLGKLMLGRNIPGDSEVISNIELLMERVGDIYLEYHDGNSDTIALPTIVEGPVFKPNKAEMKVIGIYHNTESAAVYIVNDVTIEEEKSPSEVESWFAELKQEGWTIDINPELEPSQREAIKGVIWKHKSVFVKSLQEVRVLKAEPYVFKLKDNAKPIKNVPRLLPNKANQWLKSYIQELMHLGFIEPCNGPWAATVVLVSNDKDNPQPRKRRYRKAVRTPRIKKALMGQPKPIWTVFDVDLDKEEVVEEDPTQSTLEETAEASYGQQVLSYREIDIEGNRKEFTSVSPVSKKQVKDPYRLCVNYRPVNSVTTDTGYPIPNINFLFTLLGSAKYFTVCDCMKGFWQLPLAEESRDLTGFATTFGMYRWTRLPMGLKGSPMAWQKVMDSIFFEELFKGLLIYIDDAISFSGTFEEHLVHLDQFLTKAEEANLSLSISKCRFGYTETKILGHIVGRDGFKMDPGKISRIVNWPRPKGLTELNRFIGMIQYYRRYLPGLSELISPLNALKKKNVRFHWGPPQEKAFEESKRLLSEDCLLVHPNFSKMFILCTDASDLAIGAILCQEDEDDPSVLRPVYYGSKALTDQERRISVYEKEFLAIVYFIQFFKVYLHSSKFIVYTDQKSLQYLIKFNEEASAKLIRWQASLLAYDFEIFYKPGKLNVHADALSRLPPESSQAPDLEVILEDYSLPLYAIRKRSDNDWDDTSETTRIRPVRKKRIQEKNLTFGNTGMTELEYQNLVTYLTKWLYPVGADGRTRLTIKNKARIYEVQDGVLYKKKTQDCPFRREVITSSKVNKILEENHDHLLAGHQGIRRTFESIKAKYYWPGYFETIRAYVSSCKTCQHYGPRNPPVPIEIKPRPDYTRGVFDHIFIDYISLPLTRQGHNAALVIIDEFSGWVDCYPTGTQSASMTCLSLFQWICQYQAPKVISCDNGSHFDAEIVKVMMITNYGISLHFGVPFRPQNQGKVERANGILKNILKKYSFNYKEDWDLWLPAVLYVMRTTVRRDHGFSSYMLVYGKVPSYITELEELQNYEVDPEGELEDVISRVESIIRLNKTTLNTAQINVTKYKYKMALQYNKKTKRQRYFMNDQVMIENHAMIETDKILLTKWIGPFTVCEILLGNRYRVKDADLVLPQLVHADQMKLYKSRPRLATSLKFYSKKQDPSHSFSNKGM